MKKLICILLALSMFVCLAACAYPSAPASSETATPAADAATTDASSNAPAVEEATVDALALVVGGIQTTDDPSTKALYKMSEIMEDLSGGAMTLQVAPASQLGNATSQVEAVSMGSQDMFVDAGWMGTFLQDKTIDAMWFIFDDAAHYAAYINSDLNKSLEDKFCDEQNIKIVASNWYRAPRSFCSKKPLTSVDDFKGLIIRIPDLTGYVQSVDALGGKSTQVAWGETYLALQQGVVDAAEGPIDNLYSMKFYEAAPYITVTNHLRDSMQVMINNDRWESMSEKQREILTQAALEAGDWYSEEVLKIIDEAVAAMKADGATVTEMDPEVLAQMEEILAERTKQLDDAGTYWKTGMYEQIRALADR